MVNKLDLMAVTKRYGFVTALHPTTLGVAKGEFVTLLGPSGSGKTTILQLLSGLTTPDAGEILIDGKPASQLAPHRRDIGLVFQNYALFPHLTVAENIAFPLKMRHQSAADMQANVARILDVVRLPHLADRFPAELSGGQQQRVALARCAVYEPSVILMDEPLGALDKNLRDHMQLEIKRLHRELGATILYVTHDQEEAMAMSDRICLMREGAIEQLGTAHELYFQPATAFSATFFGNPNVLDAKIIDVADNAAVIELNAGGQVTQPLTRALAPGQPIALAVRPEALRIVATEAAENSLSATLTDTMMLGPITRCYWTLADGTNLMSTALTAQGTRPLSPGDQAHLTWAAADAIIVDAEVRK